MHCGIGGRSDGLPIDLRNYIKTKLNRSFFLYLRLGSYLCSLGLRAGQIKIFS